MLDLFLENGDLLDQVELESLIGYNKGTNLKIHRIECIDQIVQTMKKTIEGNRYNAPFKAAIKIKFDESSKSVVATYDCLEYSRNFRNDEKLRNEWEGMMKSFIGEVNGQIGKLGYHIKRNHEVILHEQQKYGQGAKICIFYMNCMQQKDNGHNDLNHNDVSM